MGIDIITRYFPELTPGQLSSFERLDDIYRQWNAKINVISRKDIDSLYEKHVLHSLAIARLISFKPGTKVLDVGTGGGFPGLPLAIMFPEVSFHLVDSIAKKIMVVNEITEELALSNVSTQAIRAEQIKSRYDFVVSRAVTGIRPFIQWVAGKFETTSFNQLPNGVIFLKGGDLEPELREVKRKYRLFPISAYYSEEFFDTKKIVYIPMIK